jgi:hypothetical protein
VTSRRGRRVLAAVDVPMAVFTVAVAGFLAAVSLGTDHPASARSTGQIQARLETQPGDAAPTTVWLGGVRRPKWQRVSTVVRDGAWQCARVEPSGAVVVDLLCCEWQPDHGSRGRFVLVQRSSFGHVPPGARRRALVQECRERNGAKPLPVALEELQLNEEPTP